MRVFFSWAGTHSRGVAEAFAKHLPIVINAIKPFFSPELEKGVPWAETILKELKDTSHGLVFLTKESLDSSWVHFETGAIAKQVDKARVYTILIGLQPTDVPPPLALFQHTRIEDADDIKKLVRALHAAALQAGETSLTIEQVDTAFGLNWPLISLAVDTVLKTPTPSTTKRTRPERELIEELLELSRNHSKRIVVLSTKLAELQTGFRIMSDIISADLRDTFMTGHVVGVRKVGGTRPVKQSAVESSSSPETTEDIDFPPPSNDLPF